MSTSTALPCTINTVLLAQSWHSLMARRNWALLRVRYNYPFGVITGLCSDKGGPLSRHWNTEERLRGGQSVCAHRLILCARAGGRSLSPGCLSTWRHCSSPAWERTECCRPASCPCSLLCPRRTGSHNCAERREGHEEERLSVTRGGQAAGRRPI